MNLNFAQIKQIVSHRYPMLLIDRVREFAAGDYIWAEKNITANEGCYSGIGHEQYDQQVYAYPIPLMLESFCQAACVLGCLTNPQLAEEGYIPLLGSVHQCEVHRDAFPGDRLEHRVQVIKNMGETFVFSGEIRIDSELTASIEMILITYVKDGIRP